MKTYILGEPKAVEAQTSAGLPGCERAAIAPSKPVSKAVRKMKTFGEQNNRALDTVKPYQPSCLCLLEMRHNLSKVPRCSVVGVLLPVEESI
jgi:hypothetical protein